MFLGPSGLSPHWLPCYTSAFLLKEIIHQFRHNFIDVSFTHAKPRVLQSDNPCVRLSTDPPPPSWPPPLGLEGVALPLINRCCRDFEARHSSLLLVSTPHCAVFVRRYMRLQCFHAFLFARLLRHSSVPQSCDWRRPCPVLFSSRLVVFTHLFQVFIFFVFFPRHHRVAFCFASGKFQQ